MAWTSPKTWSADELVTNTMLNTHLRDNLNYLKAKPYGKASLATQITTASTSFTDTGLSVAVTPAGEAIIASFTGVVGISGGSQCQFDIDVNGTRQGGTDGLVCVVTSGTVESVALTIIVDGLTPGNLYTIKVQWKVNAGTGTLYAENSASQLKFKPVLWAREL